MNEVKTMNEVVECSMSYVEKLRAQARERQDTRWATDRPEVMKWCKEQPIDWSWLNAEPNPNYWLVRYYKESHSEKKKPRILSLKEGKFVEVDNPEYKKKGKLLGILEGLEDKTLFDYSPKTKAQREAWVLCKQKVAKFPQEQKGILFTGSSGIGKTHLLCGILHELSLRGGECLYARMKPIYRRAKETFNGFGNMKEIITPLMETEIVVLDDLGAEKISEWTLAVLEDVIDTRWSNKLLTFSAMNYNEDIWMREVSQKPRWEIQSERIWSRLHGLCEVVSVMGPDGRRE